MTAFAGNLLKERGKRLQTFSAVLPDNYRGSGGDERHYIDMFKGHRNLDMHYITDPWRGPYDDLPRLIRGSESPLFTSRHFLYTAFTHAAEKKRIRTILDGCFGEMGPSFHGEGCLAGQLLMGRPLATAKEILLRVKGDKRNWSRFVKGEIVKPILPFWVQKKLAPRFDVSMMSMNMPIQKSFLNEWISTAENKEMEKQVLQLLYTSLDHRINQSRLFLKTRACREQNGYVGYEKVLFSYPFADRRIIDFCLASPGWIKVKNGYNRYMIRKAMTGLAPEGIIRRTTKEPFSPDFHDRYNRQRKKAIELIMQINKNDPVTEIVDMDRLKKELHIKPRDNRCNTRNTFVTMHVIPRSVYLIQFLKHYAGSY